MENKKHGGKRVGSGRKPLPITQKRTTLNIYPTNAELYKFGDKDKMVKEVKKFIAEYGVRDLSKPTNEIKPFEQPKSNYSISTSSVLSCFDTYAAEIKDAKSLYEIEKTIKEVWADKTLNSLEKQKLELYAKTKGRDIE